MAFRTVRYNAEGRTVCLVRDKPCLCHASLLFSVSISAESSAKQRHGLESSSVLIVNVPVENVTARRGKMTVEPCFRRQTDFSIECAP